LLFVDTGEQEFAKWSIYFLTNPEGESYFMTDSILFWNEVALEANRVSHTNGAMEQTGPTLSSRALAIVHLAMYDAYAAVNPSAGLSPYLPGLPSPPSGASVQAAVAGAAHTTLSALFPSQRAFFNARLSEAGGILNPGYDFGVSVAFAILQDRAEDPNASDTGFLPSLARGRHRVDPDNPGQGFHAPFYGARSRGFAITERHELKPPPFDNQEYLTALREVRGRGIAPELMGTLPDGFSRRTIDQTLIGIVWAYDGAIGIGTPPRLYNQIVRLVAIAQGNTEAENARLFALVNTAMGDAGILAWDQKYLHDLWRPVVGIREHDMSLGLAGEADNDISDDTDTGWLPLGSPATNSTNKNFTPNFPAYPSGHATFGAAAFHITRLFYKVPPEDRKPDNLFKNLGFVSDEFNGINQDNRGTIRPRHLRNFPGGLWQMIEENGRSRVFLGVHWVFDAFAVDKKGEPDFSRNIGGVPLGLTIAEDIFKNGLKKSKVGPRPGNNHK
jgi:Vanadium chloroperoxidase N-terminal domain